MPAKLGRFRQSMIGSDGTVKHALAHIWSLIHRIGGIAKRFLLDGSGFGRPVVTVTGRRT